MSKTLKLIISLVVVFAAAGIGSVFTAPAITGWYAGLNKPVFSPPNWLFGPAWTVLYILMAYGLYLVWAAGGPKAKTAMGFFGIQLLLNSLWSIFFFGLKSPGLALVEIIVLWVMILLTILKFLKVSRTAGYLLLPYLAWVSFASILNLAVFRLN